MIKLHCFLFLLIFSCPLFVFPQENTNPEIEVSGRIIQDISIGFEEILIINHRTARGIWGDMDGTFNLRILKNDSLLISVRGYHREIISFADSIYKPLYNVEVQMRPLTITFDKPIVIRPEVKPSDIEEQQQKIGSYQRPKTFQKPMDYVFSPITALYEAFSKKAQREEEYYELLNEQAARDALKSVIQYYVQNGLFYIADQDLEQFIDFCKLPGGFIQQASLYELGAALKNCQSDFDKKFRY